MVSPTCQRLWCRRPTRLAVFTTDTAGAGVWVGVEVEDGGDWIGAIPPVGVPLAVAVLSPSRLCRRRAVTV